MKQESNPHIGKNKQAPETAYESDQISDLIGKYLKVTIINMFTVKENLIERSKGR